MEVECRNCKQKYEVAEDRLTIIDPKAPQLSSICSSCKASTILTVDVSEELLEKYPKLKEAVEAEAKEEITPFADFEERFRNAMRTFGLDKRKYKDKTEAVVKLMSLPGEMSPQHLYYHLINMGFDAGVVPSIVKLSFPFQQPVQAPPFYPTAAPFPTVPYPFPPPITPFAQPSAPSTTTTQFPGWQMVQTPMGLVMVQAPQGAAVQVAPDRIIREPVLDKDGKPVKDPDTGEVLYRTIAPKPEEQKPETDFLTLYTKIKEAGLIPTMDFDKIGAQIGSAVSKKMSELEEKIKELKTEKPEESEHLKELREQLKQLDEKLEEEKDKRHSLEVEHIEKERDKLEERIKKLEEGGEKPSTSAEVEAMKERRAAFKDVAGEGRDFAKEVITPVLQPLIETMRAQYIMQLQYMEQAGQLPKGTVAKVITPPEVKKDEVEQAKKRVEGAVKK